MLPIILQRRTCRKFGARPVEEEKINEIVKAGLHAPSGMNKQLGEIFVLQNPEFIKEYTKLNAKAGGLPETLDTFYGAPVVILVAAKGSPFADLDGGAMIQNMLLEATNQGLGTCWIHRAKAQLKLPETIALFAKYGIDIEDYEGVDHIALGYDVGPKPNEKVIREGRVHFVR